MILSGTAGTICLTEFGLFLKANYRFTEPSSFPSQYLINYSYMDKVKVTQ
jgi:hypothetical protein